MQLLQIKELDDALLVEFVDAKILDEATILQMGKELMESLPKAAGTGKMIVDFQRVQFMSSAMIGKLVLLHKRSKAEQIDLRFRNITSNVMDVFKLTRLNRIFNIDSSEG